MTEKTIEQDRPAKLLKTKPAKVLIVDDHPTVREGLAMRIERQADLAVCGEADDVAGAMKLVSETRPDIVIVDIALKEGNGIDLIKRIKARFPAARMLVWSMYSEALAGERALRAGAMGYINKEQATDKIIEGIRQVLSDRVYMSQALADRVMHRAVGRTSANVMRAPVEDLSDRELEVFQLLGRGLNTQQVASRIKVSPKTVETYRARIKQKMDLRGSSQLIQRAVQWVIENG
jgi:DNA-binding NarL/FixJ family response regulator